MTTIAMAVGMVPLAMGRARASSVRAPMAFVVIGGLIALTLLNLIVIPAFYSYIDDIVHWQSVVSTTQRPAKQPTPHGIALRDKIFHD